MAYLLPCEIESRNRPEMHERRQSQTNHRGRTRRGSRLSSHPLHQWARHVAAPCPQSQGDLPDKNK